MKLNWSDLKKITVETSSGVSLGKIRGFILNTDGQEIDQYEVGGGLSRAKLISREQVLKFENNKMIVDDTVSKLLSEKSAPSANIKTSSEPVVMADS